MTLWLFYKYVVLAYVNCIGVDVQSDPPCLLAGRFSVSYSSTVQIELCY